MGRLGNGVTALVPALGQVGAAGASNIRVIGEVADVSTGRIKFLGDGVQSIVPASGRAAGAISEVAATTASTTTAMMGGWLGVAISVAAVGLKLLEIIDYTKDAQKNIDALYDIPEIANAAGTSDAGGSARAARDASLDPQLAAAEDERRAAKSRLEEIAQNQRKIRETEDKAAGAYDWGRAREAAGLRRAYTRETAPERRSLQDVIDESNSAIRDLRKRGARTGESAGAATAKGFAAGVESNTGTMTGAMRKATDEAGKYLPHSDAEKGAFAGLTAAGEAVPSTIAEGIRPNGDEISDALREAMDKAMQDMQGVVDGTAMPVPTAGAGKPGEDRRGSAEHAEAAARMVLEYKKRADAGFTLGGLASFAGRGKQTMPEYPGPALMNLQPGEQWTRYATGPGSISRTGSGAAATKAAMAGQALVNAPDAGRMSIGGQGSGDTTQVFNFNGPLNGEDGIRQVAREEIGRAARQASYAR